MCITQKAGIRGYDVTATGDGERILPTAITERFCVGADGALEPVTSGSTRAVAQVVTHGGHLQGEAVGFQPSIA